MHSINNYPIPKLCTAIIGSVDAGQDIEVDHVMGEVTPARRTGCRRVGIASRAANHCPSVSVLRAWASTSLWSTCRVSRLRKAASEIRPASSSF